MGLHPTKSSGVNKVLAVHGTSASALMQQTNGMNDNSKDGGRISTGNLPYQATTKPTLSLTIYAHHLGGFWDIY